ncbi:alginate lyase family protein [Mucilaginibacter sp. AW1-3]
MKKTLLLTLTAFTFLQAAYVQLPNVFLLNPEHIAQQKAKYKKGDPTIAKQVAIVIDRANKVLNEKPHSVMEKAKTPPSGSKHDYMSLAPYFWPDPTKPDGKPYIRKDGQHNPETKTISDHEYLGNLDERCKYLSLAYYFTGDEMYAAKMKELLTVWFLDPDTKMNPSLTYAQAVLGVNDGRGIGIIESRSLAWIADWMGLLAGSKSFTAADLNNIKDWYKQYLVWLRTSKNGNDERNAKNNHGIHYDTQTIDYALFTGDIALAKELVTASLKRIPVQIEPDGQEPLELARTNAYGYSTFNIAAWYNVSLLADRAGLDIWNYTTPDGRSIHKALDYIIPYTLDDKPKEHQQIGPYNKDEMYLLLLLAGQKYKDDKYTKRAEAFKKNESIMVTDLLYN